MRRTPNARPSFWVSLVLGIAGCANILGIDGEYGLDEGSTEAGGTSGTGGRSSGGMPGTGGAAGAHSGGSGGIPTFPEGGDCPEVCAPGQKCCRGYCVEPSFLWGCSATACEDCIELPDNATGSCTGEQCDFECINGYEKSGGACVPTGAGGMEGTGGAPPACDRSQCPPCIDQLVYSPCCNRRDQCACGFPGFCP